MRQPYGLILDDTRVSITRAVVQNNDTVVIQKLQVIEEVTLRLADLGALAGLVEKADTNDSVLERLAQEEGLL